MNFFKYLLSIVVAVAAVACAKPVIEVTKVNLSKTTLELTEGESDTITATVEPNDATDKSVVWSSDASAVATVTEGTIKAIAPGTAKITAKSGTKSATCTVTVKAKFIAVTGLKLSSESIDLVEGDSVDLTATVEPANATDKTVTWKSSKEDVATVADGKVTAVAPGSAIITAKASDQVVACIVNVVARTISVTAITLNATETNLVVGGEPFKLVAEVKPDNATDKTIEWKSSNTSIAMVNENGMVVPVEQGECTITATSKQNPEISATCKVTVKRQEIKVTSVKLDKTSAVIYMNREAKLTATVLPDDATNKNISWSSTDASVVTVDQMGNLTAKKVGKASVVVTSEDGGKTASCSVEVQDTPVNSIRITNAPADLNVKSGTTFTPEVKVMPEDASNKDFTVTVDDSQLASVNGKTVTFLSNNGYVNVKVTSKATNSIRDVLEFRVWVPVKSIEFNLPTPKVTLGVGKKYTLSVAYTPSNAGNKKVTYKASDPSIISVSDSEITGLAPGTCTVTATSEDNPSATASIEVIVKATNKVSINGGEAVEYLTGNLSKALGSSTITSLKWTSDSYLDSDDAGAFRVSTLANSLTSLDMSKVNIVEGGKPYKQTLGSGSATTSTKKDEFPSHLLYQYKKLSSIILPSSITAIGEEALGGITTLKNVTIPESVKTIYIGAFSSTGLTGTLVIPDGVTSISSQAFENTKLSHIKIGSGLEKFNGTTVFGFNYLLEDFEVSSANQHFKSQDGALLTKDGKTLICYPSAKLVGKVTLSAGITRIQMDAVNVPEANNLECLTVPEGVTEIDKYAFRSIKNTLVLPSTLKTVSGLSFAYFADAAVVLKAVTPPSALAEYMASGPFYSGTIYKLYVPKASLELYKKDSYWGKVASKTYSIEDIGDNSDLDFREVVLF